MQFISCSYQGTSLCDDSCSSYETCPLLHTWSAASEQLLEDCDECCNQNSDDEA